MYRFVSITLGGKFVDKEIQELIQVLLQLFALN